MCVQQSMPTYRVLDGSRLHVLDSLMNGFQVPDFLMRGLQVSDSLARVPGLDLLVSSFQVLD